MNELILVEDNKPLTTTLVISEGTNVQHKNIMELVKKYSNDLSEFGTFAFQTRKSGGLPTEYAKLNERQATLLITYMRNTSIVREFKKRLVKAFYELASQVRGTVLVPSTLKDALLLAYNQQVQLEEQAPMVEAYNAFISTDDNILIGELAKVIGKEFRLGQNGLFDVLRENGVLCKDKKDKDYNLPKQYYINQEYFVVKESSTTLANGVKKIKFTTTVTTKGQAWIRKNLQLGQQQQQLLTA